jgi:hypothetical protein
MQGEPPPTGFVAYPRTNPYGTAEKLQALSDGYFGLNWIFVLNIGLAFGARLVQTVLATADNWPVVVLGSLAALAVIVGFATFPYTSKIAFGADWRPGYAILASVLIGLNSFLCCGLIGYVVVQQIASSHMKRYGLRVASIGGIRKREVEAIIAQMRASEQSPPYQPPV